MSFVDLKNVRHLKHALFLINFVYTLHFTIAVFINSSFLREFFTKDHHIGLIFTAAAVVGLVSLAYFEQLLVRFGHFKVSVSLILIDIVALSFFTLADGFNVFASEVPIVIFFVLHYSTAVFLFKFTTDLYVEEYSEQKSTGLLRGEYLTFGNVAWILSPFVAGFLLGDGDYWKVYAVSLALALLLLIIVLKYVRGVPDPKYNKVYFFNSFKQVFRNIDLRGIFMSNFLMHFFFAWMIIYTPIYLNEILGIEWQHIGLIIFPMMLLPYILVDIPLGYLADKYFGEREILITGFIILTITTAPIFFITSTSIWVWGFILMATRFGTSTIEIMSDTYLYKKVSPKDGNIMSIYSNSRPIAYVIATVLASVLLIFPAFEFQHLFLVLTVIMASGIYFSASLTDTN